MTEKKMKKAVEKFQAHGRGIFSNFTKPRGATDVRQAGEHIFPELINPKLFSPANLKSILISLNNKMSHHVNDPEIFPTSPTYFTHRTPTGELIRFSVKDAYALVRYAYLTQLNNKEIISKRSRVKEIKEQLASMRSKKEIKAELEQEYFALTGEL
jgi:hypothetical protein